MGYRNLREYQHTGPDQQDLVPAGIRLVAFDLDGTLTRGQTCLEAIADAFGFAAQTTVWEQARTEQELTAARLGMWEYLQHLSTRDMDAVLASIPLAPGAVEGITALRTAGIGTIIVSLAHAQNVAYFAGRLGVDAHFRHRARRHRRIPPRLPGDQTHPGHRVRQHPRRFPRADRGRGRHPE